MIDIRVFYTKTGRMKFVSHLDMTRIMTRAVRKTGAKVWYTEGFNPHIYITFPLPLPLGQESLCESMDLRADEATDLTDFAGKFNEALPPGIRVLRAACPERKASEITAAEYDIVFYEIGAAAEARIREVLAQSSIPVEKTGKKGKVSVVDLAEKMTGVSAVRKADTLTLSLRLPAGNTENVNPALLTGLLSGALGGSPCFDIVKKRILCSGEEFR